MRRHTRSIFLTLMTSVAITAVVAWGCAWTRPAPGGATQLPSFWKQPDGTAWMGPGQRGFGWSSLTLYGASGFTSFGYERATWVPAWIRPPLTDPVDERAVHAVAAGWPARCLRAQIIGRGDHSPQGGVYRSGLGPQAVQWTSWEHAIVLDTSPADPVSYRLLPRGVVLPGLLLNVLFWSLPGLAFAALLEVRRIRRRRQGRCPACGYPIGESSRCTECGFSVTASP